MLYGCYIDVMAMLYAYSSGNKKKDVITMLYECYMDVVTMLYECYSDVISYNIHITSL